MYFEFKFNSEFKFNNSASYAKYSEFFGDFSFTSLNEFFDSLLVTPSISQKLTKENLKEREFLHIVLENLRPEVDSILRRY